MAFVFFFFSSSPFPPPPPPPPHSSSSSPFSPFSSSFFFFFSFFVFLLPFFLFSFWQMVWEQNASVVVVLCKPDEPFDDGTQECFGYFPCVVNGQSEVFCCLQAKLQTNRIPLIASGRPTVPSRCKTRTRLKALYSRSARLLWSTPTPTSTERSTICR